ncbi:MAG: hypothetical protein ACREJ3_01845, partial [Polyangiaceae bacterium]
LPVSPAPAPLDRGRLARRTAAWIALGAGAVGIIGAVASLVERGSALSDLGGVCPQYATSPCDPSSRAAVQSAVDRGHAASISANVFGAIGVVGAVGGMILFETSNPSGQAAKLVLSPYGLSARGAF